MASTRYWRVQWTCHGVLMLSDPLPTWLDAEMYRREIGGDAEILGY